MTISAPVICIGFDSRKRPSTVPFRAKPVKDGFPDSRQSPYDCGGCEVRQRAFDKG
jgi:hypothetical protein